jgi:hypothetical protein
MPIKATLFFIIKVKISFKVHGSMVLDDQGNADSISSAWETGS